jgi:sortase A
MRTARRARAALRVRTAVILFAAGAPVAFAACASGTTVEVVPSTTTTVPPTTTSTTTTTTSTLPPTTTSTSTTTTSTTTTTTTTSTTTTTTTTTLPPSTFAPPPPQPAAPVAAQTSGREPVIELGRIEIPKIGVDSIMFEGIRMTTLDLGPGHWPGSALPGQPGNVVVAGHRTSKHKVFRNVDQLVAGDEIVFTDANGRHVYRVNRTEIVYPDAVWIINPTPTPTVTLFACHPPGSVRQRIVVFADLVTG